MDGLKGREESSRRRGAINLNQLFVNTFTFDKMGNKSGFLSNRMLRSSNIRPAKGRHI